MVFRNVLSEFSWKRWQNTGLLVAGRAIGRPHDIGLIPQAKGSMLRRFVQSVEELFPKPVLLRNPFVFLRGVGWPLDLKSNNFMHVLNIICSISRVDQKFRVESLIERNSFVRNEMYCASFGCRTTVLIISIVSLNCYLEGRGRDVIHPLY